MEDKNINLIVGVCCITLLLCVALFLGYNGTLLATGVALIGGLVGWGVPAPKHIQKLFTK